MTRTIVLLAGLFAVSCSGSPVAPGEQSRTVPTSPPPAVSYAQVSRAVLLASPAFLAHADLGSSPIAARWSAGADGSVAHDLTLTIESAAGELLATSTSHHSIAGPGVAWDGRAGEIYRATLREEGTVLTTVTLRVWALVPTR
jgi:hypothetical protein